MQRRLRTIVAATAGLAVTAAVATPASASASAPSATSDRPALQQRLDEVVAVGAVGALAEVRDEQGVWRSNSGVAEFGTTREVPIHSRFRVGSITKTFVATVVLQLADEGRLRLDDPVQRWLPGAVPNARNITVRHLLNHTSGLYDYRLTLPPPGTQAFLDNRWRTWTATELVHRAVAHPPTSRHPGKEFAYSNTNYVLLGEIVQKVTGRTYGEEIERRIIRPLRLTGTTVPGTSARIRGPHPHGYVPAERDGEPYLLDYTAMNPSVMGASGEMVSTARDLDRFFAALLAGRLLPPRLLREMETPGVRGGTYGLGLAWRDTACHVRVYGNDGDALAYQAWSYATADPRRQATVALTPDFRDDADEAVDAFLDKAFCG